jgi:hypothetical protein
MSTPMGLVGRLAGVQVWDWSDEATRKRACEIAPLLCGVDLRYDEMYLSYSTQSLLVGDQGHFLWRLLEVERNKECRQEARERIRRTAERILGEPWKLSDEQ